MFFYVRPVVFVKKLLSVRLFHLAFQRQGKLSLEAFIDLLVHLATKKKVSATGNLLIVDEVEETVLPARLFFHQRVRLGL